MRLYRTLLVSLMIAGLGAGITWPQASAPKVLTVCLGPASVPHCDYDSILAAVAMASPGDIIEVVGSGPIRPGISFVSIGDITITKSLTLRAKGKGPVAQQGEVSIQGSFIVNALGQEVTITGFTFLTAGDTPHDIGIRVQRGSAQILDNYFHPLSHILNGVGIRVEKEGSAVIAENHFSSLDVAIIARDGLELVTVRENVFVDIVAAVATGGGRPAKIIRNRIMGTTSNIGIFGTGITIEVSDASQPVFIMSNSIVDTSEGIVIKGNKVQVLDNLISNAAITGETGIDIWSSGGSQEIEISRNVIIGHTKYGIAFSQNPCFTGQLAKFEGKISGSGNLLALNQQGDLCPADYPWPPGFVKP